jgi:hypothetical protein
MHLPHTSSYWQMAFKDGVVPELDGEPSTARTAPDSHASTVAFYYTGTDAKVEANRFGAVGYSRLDFTIPLTFVHKYTRPAGAQYTSRLCFRVFEYSWSNNRSAIWARWSASRQSFSSHLFLLPVRSLGPNSPSSLTGKRTKRNHRSRSGHDFLFWLFPDSDFSHACTHPQANGRNGVLLFEVKKRLLKERAQVAQHLWRCSQHCEYSWPEGLDLKQVQPHPLHIFSLYLPSYRP